MTEPDPSSSRGEGKPPRKTAKSRRGLPTLLPRKPRTGKADARDWRELAGLGVAVLALLSGALIPLAIDQCWLGLGSCQDRPDVRIDATSSLFNSPGYDDPADEYVCLLNAESSAVQLGGWQLREGNGDVVNTLPSFSLAPGASVRIHPGEGRNTAHDLFGESGSPVWNNGGDSVTLVDAAGEEIASVPYGEQEERSGNHCS